MHCVLRQVRRLPIPRHIGIILDGNRRHGERHGIRDPRDVYGLGARKLDDVLNWCSDLGVAAVTLWVFSTENLESLVDQVSGILAAIEAKVRALVHDPQIHQRRVRVQAIGKLELLQGPIIAAIRAARKATATYDGMTLTIAVAYGGREEIADAVRALLAEPGETGAHVCGRHQRDHAIGDRASSLYGGSARPEFDHSDQWRNPAVRLLLWQSAHSEFYFCDVSWPAFRKIELLRAVRDCQHRSGGSASEQPRGLALLVHAIVK